MGGIGLEPTTSAMSKQCSNQLSYPPNGTRIIPTPGRLCNGALYLAKSAVGDRGELEDSADVQAMMMKLQHQEQVYLQEDCGDRRHRPKCPSTVSHQDAHA